MKISINIIMLLCAVVTFGQHATVTGHLESANADGLHLIQIPQQVRSYATPNLKDFRIWDAKAQQVPYFIYPESSYVHTNVSNFSEFTILSNERHVDSSSTYIFKNQDKTLTQAVLSIANYQGNKKYRLEGSHDKKEWFGIVNRGELQHLNHPEKTSVFKVINFPICNYPYLKLVFDDRYSLPIHLLQIGKARAETTTVVPVSMETLQTKNISFIEAGKTTQVRIAFQQPQTINQLQLSISSPELYSRKATIYKVYEQRVNRDIQKHRKSIMTFDIRSDNDLIFNLPKTVAKDLYIKIENKDNPKLQISKLQVLQKPVYVVAHLKKNEAYTITAGDTSLDRPDYDISEVTQTQTDTWPLTHIVGVTPVTAQSVKVPATSFWQQPWFMWCCIGFAALIIVYFAYNLIQDMNANAK